MEKSKAEESRWLKKRIITGSEKKERVSISQEKRKTSFAKATGTGGVLRWRPDFEQRSRR